MKKNSGFTLIELLTAITVLAILVSIAAPSFKTTIQNNRLVSQSNDFLGALIYARSQAVTNNANVVLCASTNQTSCSTSASDWKNGWIIGTGTPTAITGVLRVHEALAGSNTLTNGATVANVVFTGGTGFPVIATPPLYFSLCDSRGASYGRSIYLSAVGEARISTTAGKKITGASLSC